MKRSFFYKNLLIGFLLQTLISIAQEQRNLYDYIYVGTEYYSINHSYTSSNYVINFLTVQSNIKSDNILQMDSILSSSITGSSSKVTFEYDSDNHITEELIQFNDGLNWVNDLLGIFYYDTSGRLIQDIRLGWNSIEWDSLNRINYTYNSQGYLLQYVLQAYDSGSWLNSSRSTNNYDSTGKLISQLFEIWQDTTWQNDLIVYSFYSGQNRRDSLLFELWNYNHWENFHKTIFYYDEQTSFLDSLVVNNWNGNNWQYYLKRIVENDHAGNQIRQIEQLWTGTSWGNSVQRFYLYNEFNYVRNAYCQLWIGNNWVDGDDVIVIANPDGYTIGFITHDVNIYYKTTDVSDNNINSSINNFILEQNYPNPFNPSTRIKFTISDFRFTILKVYDVLGTEIATLVNEKLPAGNYEVEFNAANLSSGVYFYTIRSGNFVETKKMILMR